MKKSIIETHIKKYLDEMLTIGNLSETSVYNRRFELNRFYSFCLENNINDVDKISKNSIVRYLSGLRVSKSTKKTILAVLASFLDYLNNEGVVIDNVAYSIKPPKTSPRPPDHLTTQEIKNLFETEKLISPPLFVDRNLLIYSLLFYLCLRINELVNLKLSDVRIDGDRKEIWVTRKGGFIMALGLNEFLVKRFENWFAARKQFKGCDSDWVFLSKRGNRIAVRSARAVVENGIKKTGIVKNKNGPHVLRHSGASYYSKLGKDPRKIQFLMGHKNIHTTMRYLHFDSQELTEMIDSCPEII